MMSNRPKFRFRFGLPLAVVAAALSGCQTSEQESNDVVATAGPVVAMEQAHGQSAWDGFKVVTFGADIQFGGKVLSMLTEVEPETWTIAQTVLSPSSATIRHAGGLTEVTAGGLTDDWDIEHVATFWPHVYAAPFRVATPGTRFEYVGSEVIDGYPYEVIEVQYDDLSGSPFEMCHYYITAADNEVGYGHLAMMRYPVDGEEHVAVFEPLLAVEVDGAEIIFPQTVEFYRWTADGPDMGESLGMAQYTFISAR
jgi:hypothetical protein